MHIRLTLFFFLCGLGCAATAQQTSNAAGQQGSPSITQQTISTTQQTTSATQSAGQQPGSAAGPGSIIGTVTDVQDEIVPGATVVLDSGSADAQKTTANQNGFFTFSGVRPGVEHHVTVRADGFAAWSSPAIELTPEEYRELGSIRLTFSVASTTVTAVLPPEEIATQQVDVAVKQRALGILPEFYAVYSAHPVPLTPKLKFKLAWRTATDPVTIAASAFIAGIDQASDTPDYVQGAKGYGQRFGANYANGVTDIFIAGAVLPTILHQDPRYYYKGTGSRSSRVWHAVRNPLICKGDKGHWQPNVSSLGGYLASGAIANTYYPEEDRGVGLVFGTMGVDIGADMVSSLIQEFLVHRGKH